MSDVKFTTNIPQVLVEMESFERKLGGLDSSFQKVNRAGEEAFKGVSRAADAAGKDMGGLIDKAQALAAAEAQAAKSTHSLSESLKGASNEIELGGVNVSNLVTQLKGKVSVLRNVVGALGSGSGALKAFRVALISTGIGAIVVLLGSLYALFTRNQKAVDEVNKVLAGLGAVVNVVMDRLVALAAPIGKAVQGLFQLQKAALQFVTGNFTEAVETAKKGTELFGEAANGAKDALSGMGDEMKREAALAYELEGNLQRITRAQQLLNIQRAGSKRDIEKLKGLANDESKASGQRISAAQKAYGIEQSLLKKQLENQKALIANTLGQTAFTENTASFINKLKTGTIEFDDALKQVGFSDGLASDFQAVESQVIELFNIEQESLEVQTSLNNKLNEIRSNAAREQSEAQKEEKRRVDELLKKYQNITEALTSNATAVGDEQASAEEKVIRVRDRSIAQLQDLKTELNDITAQLKLKGQVVSFDTDAIISNITDFLEVEAQREIDKLKFPTLPVGVEVKPFVKDKIAPVNTEIGIQFVDTEAKADFEKKAEELFAGLSRRQKQIAESQKGGFNIWQDVFGLSPENDQAAIDGIKAAANELVSAISAVSAARVDAADKAVDASERELSEAQRALDVEIAIAQLGFASNVSLRQKELDQAEAAREKAIESQKKAQKQQLVVDTVTQSVNLITSASNIFKSLSAIPFVGVPLAIGVIATMFAAFAKVKADSFAAAKFGDGGEGYINRDGVVVGKSHRNGGVPLEIEGGEMFRTDGKRFSVVKRAMTEKHSGLLGAVNNDDTAEIARYAMALAASEGVSFKSLDYDEMERKHSVAAPRSSAIAGNASMEETNELLRKQLEKMPDKSSEVRWEENGARYRRVGNVTFKTKING